VLLLKRAARQGIFASRHLTMFQVTALNMLLEVEQKDKAKDQEWQMKMALLAADPAHFGPVVFPAPKEEEPEYEDLQPGELTVSGFHPDVVVKYATVPTPEEVEEILAQFDPSQVMGVEDFQYARDERLTNGSSQRP
jgi:hypothetical protein